MLNSAGMSLILHPASSQGALAGGWTRRYTLHASKLDLCIQAATAGNLESLRELHRTTPASAWCTYLDDIREAAARASRPHVLDYCCPGGTPWSWVADVSSSAAAAGNLQALKYAHYKGWPVDAGTFRKACLEKYGCFCPDL